MPIGLAAQVFQGTGGALDRFGRAVLAVVDYRVVSIAVLAALGLFILAYRLRHGRYPPLDFSVKVLHGCAMITTGLVVACVFLLTSPPAVEELSHESWGVIGIVTLLLTLYYGCKLVKEAFTHD